MGSADVEDDVLFRFSRRVLLTKGPLFVGVRSPFEFEVFSAVPLDIVLTFVSLNGGEGWARWMELKSNFNNGIHSSNLLSFFKQRIKN